MNIEYFSLFSQETPVNESLSVVFNPQEELAKYTCRVYNDGILVDVIRVFNNEPHQINLVDTGNYQIKVEAYDTFDRRFDYESGVYRIDKLSPNLSVGDNVLTFYAGSSLDVMSGVKATDNYDGDITSSVTSNIDELDLSLVGTQKLIYSVSDQAGNTTTKTVILNIQKHDTVGLFMIQLTILIVLLGLIALILHYRKTIKLEKRFGKYSILPLVDKSPSLFDKVINLYRSLVMSLSKVIKKSVFLTRYAKHFDKYLLFTKDRYQSGIDFVSSKILLSFIFLIIAVISKALQYKVISMYEVCFPLLLGFFVLDIFYALQYKLYRDKVENDLLQAIIIMNNAFKSGRSIVQAVELVGEELKGVVGEQFKKMRYELSSGLNIEEVFSRFALRINVEEVTYLTASLSILNKTGGNIIKVFSSIEHSLFMKKKLKLELKSLTGSSKIIMWVLFCVPVLFIVVISMMSPGYFLPFFETPVGIVLFIIMLIYYIIYVVAVRKILKVRM